MNGPLLVNQNDQWISHGMENLDLINTELKLFNLLLHEAKRLRPDLRVVIDGGANMGSWTVPLAKQHTDLTFHMFEVQRMIYYCTCGNLALNMLTNVYANWAGFDDREHVIELNVPDYTSRNNYGAYEVVPPEKNSDDKILYTAQVDRVKMVTIDSLGLDPLFIKLDVEGMEWRTLQGAMRTLDRCEPVVWCERHKSDPDKVLPFFDTRGYALTSLIEGHWTFIPPWLQINNMKNVTDILLSR